MPKAAKPKSLGYHLAVVNECIRDVRAKNVKLQGQIDRWLTLIDNQLAERLEAFNQATMIERKAELRGAISELRTLRNRLADAKRTKRKRKRAD